jgi:ribulose 1,5-bisphosphate synthetase/thiazole synthase
MLGLGLGASKGLTAAATYGISQTGFETSVFKTRVQNDGGTWEAELSLNNEITRLQAI